MASVLREDPARLNTTLKEAIAEAIVNLTHSEISGAGSIGAYLFGAKPRTTLNSGFLLPQKSGLGDDEVTSPIWISSHGVQIQIAEHSVGKLKVQPSLSVYVRVLPMEDDLKRPNCGIAFRMRREVARELKTTRNARLDAEWEKVKGNYTSRNKHPDWNKIREEITAEIYNKMGIPKNIHALDAEEPNANGEEVEEQPSLGVITTGGTPHALSDAIFEPMTVPHKWMRLPMQLPLLELDLSLTPDEMKILATSHAAAMNATISSTLQQWRDSEDPSLGGKAWGYRHGIQIPASQYKKWPEFLASVRTSKLDIATPQITLDWNLHIAPDWQRGDTKSLLIALENKSEEVRKYADEVDQAIFQVALEICIPNSAHRPLGLERIEPSYRYNEYLTYGAMGHNCGVAVVEKSPESIKFKTTWAPRYVQPRIVPTEIPGVVRGVRALSEPNSLEGLKPLLPALKAWIDDLAANFDPSRGLSPSDVEGNAREKHAFASDLAKWGSEYKGLKAGLEILEESRASWSGRGPQTDPRGVVYEAWLAMNEAMANFMKLRFKHDDSAWRLFQIAFIVANVPSLASRLPEFKHHYHSLRDDCVTLLYFATGGGKSEAFFGLLLFNLMLDRLRGKALGVTAMLRYPLRLLTIQQAQRCARVLAQAELVRRNRNYGGAPFSMGFWVGSSGSPNRHNDKGVSSLKDIATCPADLDTEIKLREDDRKYLVVWRAWNKIPTCPFCGHETALRLFPLEGGTIAHVCTDVSCPSNEGTFKPLPFYICDEDIYDYAPSVLLGTVDKLALIGHSASTIRRIYGMFGMAPWRSKTTGRLIVPARKDLKDGPAAKNAEGLAPAYPAGPRLFLDPFPSLLIQDEAHLLDESLGAFAGLFESTLDAVFEHLAKSLGEIVSRDTNGKRRRAKVIAASATVSEPERQLEHLYQREIPAVQFPHPGPSLYSSFYAAPQKAEEDDRRMLEDPECSSKEARFYCAFMTNGKPHTSTTVAVLSSFHLSISRLFEGFTSDDNSRAEACRELLMEYADSGPLAAYHRSALLSATNAEIVTAVDLHRIALTYVTNKKGGDQIMAAELEETRKRHLNKDVPLDGLDTQLITGSVEQGEIQAVVASAQKRDEPGNPFTPLSKVLRSVIATSAISHGVDVEELNSMFFAGMPSDIAEYIQASSRVGRTHVGFVVLIPTPQRRRDRHIVEIFDIFHRFLERMVQPAAIDRWAEKAVERVFPSLFQAYLTGVVPSRNVIEFPEEAKHSASDYTFIPEITTEFRARGTALVREINDFIELAIGLKDGYAPEGEEHYRQLIEGKTRHFLSTWASSSMWGDGPLRSYFDGQTDPMKKPMTSLRDVDVSGVIRMSFKDAGGHRQTSHDVRRAMDILRHGVAEGVEGAQEL